MNYGWVYDCISQEFGIGAKSRPANQEGVISFFFNFHFPGPWLESFIPGARTNSSLYFATQQAGVYGSDFHHPMLVLIIHMWDIQNQCVGTMMSFEIYACPPHFVLTSIPDPKCCCNSGQLLLCVQLS